MENSYFISEMREMLTDEQFELFLKTQDNPMYKALRVNNLKGNIEQIKQEVEVGKVSKFDKDTYLLSDDAKLGKHPYHIGGLYYLQEPSATMVVNALDVKENDYVLDLCAAPGGKSTHILSRLNNTGFLLSNEYDHKRSLTLLSNIERCGGSNVMVTNSTVEKLCPQLKGFFDKIVVDAPCSGASMFKKYPETIKDYNLNSVLACAKRQLGILDYAYMSLKENGTLVYSTCTYNKYENEGVVEQFLEKYPDMELVDPNLDCGTRGFDKDHLTIRVFPFDDGEGHFLAKFIKKSSSDTSKVKRYRYSKDKLVDDFIKHNYNGTLSYTIFDNKVYVTDEPILDLKTQVIRSGVMLGEIVKNRIEPAHHFFVAFTDFKNICDLTSLEEANKFLKGLSLEIPGYKGYVQIRYKGVAIGFGKGDNLTIKNHFPKGLRIMG